MSTLHIVSNAGTHAARYNKQSFPLFMGLHSSTTYVNGTPVLKYQNTQMPVPKHITNTVGISTITKQQWLITKTRSLDRFHHIYKNGEVSSIQPAAAKPPGIQSYSAIAQSHHSATVRRSEHKVRRSEQPFESAVRKT